MFLGLFTYFSFAFIIGVYGFRLIKYALFPPHLRWELYPVIHEDKFSYGGSYLEELEWWKKKRKKRRLKGFLFLLKDYFTLSQYTRMSVLYWLGLYFWHLGFILMLGLHFFSFLCSILAIYAVEVSPSSSSLLGKSAYYAMFFTSAVGYISGMWGSLVVMLSRILIKDLRDYAVPLNFFTYFFTFLLFFTGFYSWFFTDLDLLEYRDFWIGLLTFEFKHVGFWTGVHVVVSDLFLFYLPFTRWLHYLTRFFGFYLLRWDDEPLRPGSRKERSIVDCLGKVVSWSAPHIQKGKKWIEVVKVST